MTARAGGRPTPPPGFSTPTPRAGLVLTLLVGGLLVALFGMFCSPAPGALLVLLIRRSDVDAVRQVMTAFHQWATPRLIAAAALAAGEPMHTLPEVAR